MIDPSSISPVSPSPGLGHDVKSRKTKRVTDGVKDLSEIKEKEVIKMSPVREEKAIGDIEEDCFCVVLLAKN